MRDFHWWVPVRLTVRLFCSKNIPGEIISSSAKMQPWGFTLYREGSVMLQLKKLSMDFIFSEGIVNYTIQRGR
jgi:hypothetical protein